MRKRLSLFAVLLALMLAPASARASDHQGLFVVHAAPSIVVPLVVHHGDATVTTPLFVAPLAAPIVVRQFDVHAQRVFTRAVPSRARILAKRCR